MGEIYQFSFPTEVVFGSGSVRGIADTFRTQGCRKVLVVTDSGLAALPVFSQFIAKVENGIETEVFSGIEGNPVESQVMAGVNAFSEAQADAILAVGGGAALDVAKVIGLMVHHPGRLFDYEDGKSDAREMTEEVPFLVAVPTTAGTGSEVGRSSVVSDDQTHAKKIIFGPKLLPKKVFLDPELTLGLPASVTAATGMDALTHLIEAYVAKGFHPICDGIALEGLRMVSSYLEKAVKAGSDAEARGQMLLAASMGAIAFQKGLGVTHSCAHALSTVCDTHHGLANGVLLPYTLEFNQEACEDRFKRMAGVVGVKDLIAWVVELKDRIGIPKTLKETGVSLDSKDRLVEVALKDGCHLLNPKPVSQSDFEGIFRKAIG